MSNNNYNFHNREERAKTAKKHTEEMESKYSTEIKECVAKSIIYRNQVKPVISMEVLYTHDNIVVPMDSVSAAFTHTNKNEKNTILNFASYKNSGGMFIEGSRAQEECLCHESFLYNVLREKTEYYAYNNEHKNNHLYTDAAIYTPDVVFEHYEEVRKFNVITCAAPNFKAASSYKNVAKAGNFAALKSRIKMILSILQVQGADTAILGAFGCGVFGQEPLEVANIFKVLANQIQWNNPIKLIYAVPKSDRDSNYNAFAEVFGKN